MFRSSLAALCALLLSATAHSAPVTSLRVMTFNIWNITDATRLARLANVASAASADIIGLQEATGVADDIAALVPGYNYFHRVNSDLSYISRYPLSNPVVATGGRSAGITAQLSPGQFAHIFNAHFEPYPYQPYDFRDGLITTEAQAIAGANTARGVSKQRLIDLTAPARATGEPVFVVGDFNEPSHLDWTAATATAGLHFGKQVEWPTSKAITDLGFRDAFRTVRPDPVATRGETWTPGAPPPNVSANEVHDRIDIIYSYPNRITPTQALTLGFNASDGNTDIAVPNFPSDHRAVVAEFDLRTVLPGDYNINGVVDAADYTLWRDELGTSTALANVTTPGSVLPEDYDRWANNFGATAATVTGVTIPEPAAMVMAIMALMARWRR